LLFTGISVFALVWITILGVALAIAWDKEPSDQSADKPIPTVKLSPIPPKAPDFSTRASLSVMSFHLENGQSSPIFRVPVGRRAHVSVYGGAAAVYSGGVLQLSCDTRGFWITGKGEGARNLWDARKSMWRLMM
jgi:hypothetical protein